MNGKEVTVDGHTLLVGGINLDPELLKSVQLVVSLCGRPAFGWPTHKPFMSFPVLDFHAPEQGEWEAWLECVILPMLAKGTRLAVHCMAGIGRTGMFVASLIALCEPEIDDPIAEARKRYRRDAVETTGQMELVFALREQKLPDTYYLDPKGGIQVDE